MTLHVLLVKVRGMHSSLFTRLLLVFVLLFTQMGSLAHGVSHILAEGKQDSGQPHDKYCDQCAAYAQIGSAVNSSTVGFCAGKNCETLHSHSFRSCTADTCPAFAARAPPYPA